MEKEKNLIVNREQKVREIQKFTLFSDVFISVVLKDKEVCQYVFRILTGKKNLCIKQVRTQYVLSKVISHGARLDVFAEAVDGIIYSLEIQKRDTVDHPRRIRFYEAMIDSEMLEKGVDYEYLPEVHMLYISKTDIKKGKQTVYSVEKRVEENGQYYDDGLYIRYINAAVNDGSEIAKLMQYFKVADPNDMSQGILSEKVRYLKLSERGIEYMCEVTERFVEWGRLAEKKAITNRLKEKGMSLEYIAQIVNESIDVIKEWIKAG